MNVIFHVPVKVFTGKKDEKKKSLANQYVIYPKSKRSVVVDDALKEDWFFKSLIEEGKVAVIEGGPKTQAVKAPAQKTEAK